MKISKIELIVFSLSIIPYPFKEKNMDAAPKIRVVVRKRPLTQKELRKGDTDIIRVYNPQ